MPALLDETAREPALLTKTPATRESVGPAPMVLDRPASDKRTDAIRQAAYTLYEARGCTPGHDLDDWLKAEAQVNTAPA